MNRSLPSGTPLMALVILLTAPVLSFAQSTGLLTGTVVDPRLWQVAMKVRF